jgi:hypothetical protein
MSIDNRFEQVDELIASDERQNLPKAVEDILNAISKVPFPGVPAFIAAIRRGSENRRRENVELMRKTVWEELQRVSANLDDLAQDLVRRDEVERLILDAVEKSDDLRDRKRVERISKILAHAITLGPPSGFDKAEEMMRIARDLSDEEVLVLRHLYDSQFAVLSGNNWNADNYQVTMLWKPPHMPRPALPGEEDSIFLKLQGLGLAIAMQGSQNMLPGERTFALLPKGADFVHYMRGAVKKV